MSRYIVLLRGINVGGNNIIKMADLRNVLEEIGFEDVETYIQSGNVLFSSASQSVEAITKKLRTGLKKAFGYTNPVLVIPENTYQKIVASAPKGYGSKPDAYRYDVLFLFPSLTPARAMKEIQLRAGIDHAEAGYHAIFHRRSKAQMSKSYLSKLTQLPIYQEMTVRNWNTTKKLLEKLNQKTA